jgi:hypothetical protein
MYPRGRAMSVRTHRGVRADVSVLSPGYFITDAIVHPSHGRSSRHCLTVRLSAIVPVTTLVESRGEMKLMNATSVIFPPPQHSQPECASSSLYAL